MACGLAEEETRLVTSRTSGHPSPAGGGSPVCHGSKLARVDEHRMYVAHKVRDFRSPEGPGSGTARRPPAGGPVRGNQPRSVPG